MNEAKRKKRNEDRFKELYPSFRARVIAVIKAMEDADLRPRIQDGWRSPEDQKIKFEKGYAKVLFGFHNVVATDGTPESLAVDVLDDNSPLEPSKSYLLQLAAAAQEAGLITGIRWGVPQKLRSAIDKAIATRDWSAPVKIGWDPTHVEPIGLTIAEAKAGKRPA